MRPEIQATIETLQREIAELERQIVETKQVINRLCRSGGEDPIYPDAALTAAGASMTIVGDSFYGKSMITAAREFLEMKKATTGSGPASPRQVYEALVKGGYKFETKDETNAIISVRSTLRKNSSVFHRLPNAEYGLLSWYPNAKVPKESEEESAPKPAKEKATTAQEKPAPQASSESALGKLIARSLESGGEWTIDALQEEAKSFGVLGSDGKPPAPREIYRALMGLKNRKMAVLLSKGIWAGPKHPAAALV